mgnify:CR=1
MSFNKITQEADMLFRLSMDNFENFYESHETRESKIALEAVKNLHSLFQSYCRCYEEREKVRESQNGE